MALMQGPIASFTAASASSSTIGPGSGSAMANPLQPSSGTGPREAEDGQKAPYAVLGPQKRVGVHSDQSPLAPDDPAHPTLAAPGDVRTEISDGLVALLKEFYGRGPEKTKTYVNEDLVVCLLRGGFTRVEQTLFEAGHGDDVIRQRMAFQQVMRHRLEEVVEAATGRRVVGFMSGHQQDPDMICEIFVLAPNELAH
jgi:uncharacterized protein YbcI